MIGNLQRSPYSEISEHFCPRDVQRKQFDVQLRLASLVKLPLFLHCRAAQSDFIDALKRAQIESFRDQPMQGVVHTFDGSWMHAEQLIQMGLYLGINGCSLKTEDELSVSMFCFVCLNPSCRLMKIATVRMPVCTYICMYLHVYINLCTYFIQPVSSISIVR